MRSGDGQRAVRAGVAVAAAGLACALLMVLVGWRAQRFVAQQPDPYGFVALARGLVREGHFVGEGTLLRRRGPGYPAFIAGIYLVTGERDLPVKLAQALLFAGTCLLAFDIGRRLFGTRAGVCAGVLCATHPVLLRYVPDYHLETLLTFLATGAAWASVLLWERPTVGRGALFGVLCGLASLVKAVFVLYPLVYVVAWAVATALARPRRGPEGEPGPPAAGAPSSRHPLIPSPAFRWLPALCALLAAGLTILPWTVRNYRVTGGHFVLVSTGVSDAYLRGLIFSKPEYALLRLPPYTFAENESNAMLKAICAREGAVWEQDDYQTEQILNRAAAREIAQHPGALVRKFVVGLFTFWYQLTSRSNSLIAAVWALAGWVLALVGWRHARRQGRVSWPAWLPILYLNVSLALLLALGRYSAPVVPALMVLAGAGVEALLPRRAPAPAAEQPAGSAIG